MNTPTLSALFCTLLCSTTLLPAALAAENPDEPSASGGSALDTTYRKLIKEGVTEYDARHFEEARSLFRRAHELSPNARTFRGLGMTSFELRDYVSAVHNLSAALRDQRKQLSAEQRKDTQELLDRSRMFVDVVTLTVSPPKARVLIDARPPEFESDGTLLFGFGTHTVEAQAPGRTSRSLSIVVRGGERKQISLTLEPVPAPAAAPLDPAAPNPALAARPLPAKVSNRGAAAWLAAGGGAALLAAGAGVYWSMQNSQLDSCRHPPTTELQCTNESSITRQRNIAVGTTLVSGAAAITMALVGILTWQTSAPPVAKHAALDCTVSPLGITCGGTFR